MIPAPSKFAINSFDAATKKRFPLTTLLLNNMNAQLIGLGMQIYSETPERVDELFDVNILRGAAQNIPEAPLDTAWDPATRTLSCIAMPVDATHIQAWRQGEGGAPELLAEGGTDEMTVGIPSSFTFDAGESYDLWITGKNSKGSGPKGPVVVWTAP